MVVVKFGGTSVGAVPQIDKAAHIVLSMRESKPVVILSAMGGVTDLLLQAGEAAVSGQIQVRDDKLWEIRSRHDQAINELFKDRSVAAAIQDIQSYAGLRGSVGDFTAVGFARESDLSAPK